MLCASAHTVQCGSPGCSCRCTCSCSHLQVEALKDAPCIRATGDCKHVFHYQCVKDKLAARWPGARVTFEFRGCPVCKQTLQHPALADVLMPILEMEHNVKEKALARLKYEGRDKAPEVRSSMTQHAHDAKHGMCCSGSITNNASSETTTHHTHHTHTPR